MSKSFFEIIFEVSNETNSISVLFFDSLSLKDLYLPLLFKVPGKAFQ